MVGSAVAMMVWFSAARNAASIRPKKMVRTSAWLIAARGGLAAAATSAGVAAPGLPRRAIRRRAPPLPDAHSHAGPRPRGGLGKIHRDKQSCREPRRMRSPRRFEVSMLQSNIALRARDFNGRRVRAAMTLAVIARSALLRRGALCGPRSGRSSIASTATKPAARNTAPAANSQRNTAAKSAPATAPPRRAASRA